MCHSYKHLCQSDLLRDQLQSISRGFERTKHQKRKTTKKLVLGCLISCKRRGIKPVLHQTGKRYSQYKAVIEGRGLPKFFDKYLKVMFCNTFKYL